MLELRHVSKRFAGGPAVLDRLSFRVEAGEIVALLGGSGTGKSTILRLIAGLDQPTGGEVLIDGRPVGGPTRDVGVVFQEPRLMPWLDVEDNVGFGLPCLEREERRRRIGQALARVGLAEARALFPKQLSGGMAQRAALARALVLKPRILLLDEPFSALDALLRGDLQDHLLELWADTRPTMLLVTHDIEEALRIADRVLVLAPNGSGIADEVRVDLDRPRDRYDPAFTRLGARLLASLGRRRSAVPGEIAHPAAAI